MNKLTIPPSPNWYQSNVLACAPDNTVIYGSRYEIVVIPPCKTDEPADIKIINFIHTQRILGVVINPNWDSPDKLVATCAEDNTVRLIDINTCTSQQSHSGHTVRPDKVVGVTFAGNDKVVSVSEDGFIIIWRLGANQLTSLKNIFPSKYKICCISSCPHIPWLTAFGTKRGQIFLVDLRKNGKIIHHILNAYDNSIVSLSWCPVPCNVFSENKQDIKRKDIQNVNESNKTDSNLIVSTSSNVSYPTEDIEQPCHHSNDNNISSHQITEQDFVKTDVHSDFIANDDESVNEATVTDELLQRCSSAGDQPLPCNSTINYEIVEMDSPTDIYNSIMSSFNKETIDNICEPIESPTEAESSSPGKTTTDNNTETVAEKSEESIDDSPLIESPRTKAVSHSECLLASSAKGSSAIKIWRAGTDGLLEKELILPGKQRNNRSNRHDDRSWITTCWITPRDLLSSSHKAELLHWRLLEVPNKDGEMSIKCRLIHSDHDKQLFNIASPIRKYESVNDENWTDKNLLNVWTSGKERFLINTSLSIDHKTLALYPCLASSVNQLKASPIDPTRIAIAMGDGHCKMWDISKSHLQFIIMNDLYEKGQIKFTSISWHPVKEFLLAFGTGDGQVGVIDTNNKSKDPINFIKFSNSSIHNIEWGPLNGDLEVFGLYVLSSGKLMVYDLNKNLNDPIPFNNSIDDFMHMFSWKPDYGTLAIGSKAGEVLLFSSKLELMSRMLLLNKSIHCLEWHPIGYSKENWLAIASKNTIVFDCSITSVSQNRDGFNEGIIANFNEPLQTVRCVAWNPHEEGVLACAVDHGLVFVWSVLSKSLLHCVVTPRSTINSILWSPLSSRYIISGEKDSIIQVFDLDESPPEKYLKIAEEKRKQKVIKLDMLEASQETKETKEDTKTKKTTRKHFFNGIAQIQNPNQQSDLVDDCKRLFEHFYKNGKCNKTTTKFDILQLFGDKEDITTLLKLERESHLKKPVLLYNESISLWQGDIGDAIKKAISSGTLNHFHISAAPMISYNLWQEACEAYAQQLMDTSSNRPVEAAYYFLLCQKVEEAINALLNCDYYREALILAKCRLQEGDPMNLKIVEKWIEYCVQIGNFEVAAQCYIALNKLEDAIKILFRRTDLPTLKFCVELAEQLDNKELLNAVQYRVSVFDDSIAALSIESEKNLPSLLPRYELEIKNSEQPPLCEDSECKDNKETDDLDPSCFESDALITQLESD